VKTNSVTDQDFELWVLFHQASDAAVKASDIELGKFGLSWIQAGVLVMLKSSPEPPSPTEISRWLLREPHTLSALLNRMEKHGLIRRTRDSLRKNVIRVLLTEKGEDAYGRIMQMDSVHEILSCLSLKEKGSLMAYSKKLRTKALEQLVIKRKWELPFS